MTHKLFREEGYRRTAKIDDHARYLLLLLPPEDRAGGHVEAAWAVPAIPHARTIPERTSLRIDVLLLRIVSPARQESFDILATACLLEM